MNVSLTPELERLVAAKVESGMYGSSSEVIRAALRAFDQMERDQAAKLEALRREIRLGVEEADRGELFDGQRAFRALIGRRSAKRTPGPAAKHKARRPKRGSR